MRICDVKLFSFSHVFRDPSIPWKELTIGKPVPHEETEADRELKRLLQKQMESNVSIFRDKYVALYGRVFSNISLIHVQEAGF
jgi:hypothetical protein